MNYNLDRNGKGSAEQYRRIPYGTQWIDDADITAVIETLRSNYLTTGPKIAEFEAALCTATGAKYAVAVNSGTAALHAACFAAGIKPGDEVITTPITFAATANAVLYMGGTPVFCDIDSATWNIDPAKIEALITAKTKAIIPVHYTGQPSQMDQILDIAKRNNLIVIEDAAHALGAHYNGAPVGAIGAMTCFSFHPVKHITTGEGGAITTNSATLYQKMIQFRTHGITRDLSLLERTKPMQNATGTTACNSGDIKKLTGTSTDIGTCVSTGTDSGVSIGNSASSAPQEIEPWYYEQQFLGFNYRITDIQAALGVSQLAKLPAFLRRRREIVQAYYTAFQPLAASGKLQLQRIPDNTDPAWHIFIIKVPAQLRNSIFHSLQNMGLGVNLHYIPVYLHPYYQRLGYTKGLCPEAESLYDTIITLPLYPKMSDEDVAYVVNCVRHTVSANDNIEST